MRRCDGAQKNVLVHELLSTFAHRINLEAKFHSMMASHGNWKAGQPPRSGSAAAAVRMPNLCEHLGLPFVDLRGLQGPAVAFKEEFKEELLSHRPIATLAAAV